MAGRSRGFGGWALLAFAIALVLFGLPLFAGGVWLVALGGSFYYVLAGVGLILSGILLAMDRQDGAWLYGAVFIATVAWAFWEVGLDGWALVPRLVGPAVLAILLLLLVPVLRRRRAVGGAPS